VIVVDRVLNAKEAADLAGRPVLDLRGGVRPAATPAQDALIAWIDRAHAFSLAGQPVDAYFGWAGHSYWLHVRARLFFDLFGDAQLLDRLPDRGVLPQIERVYCDATAAGFWARWAPQARRVVAPAEPAAAPGDAPKRQLLRPSLRRLPELLGALRQARSRPWGGVFFSMSSYNVTRPEGLWDRQLGPLFDRHREGDWLRLEYEPLAGRLLALRQVAPRLHPTLSTDAVLAAYLLRRPLALAGMLRAYRALRRRFACALQYDYPFPFGGAVWEAMLHASIRRLPASIGLFDLLRRAFEWLLDDLSPRFAVATGENNSIGRLFVEAARRCGLPSFGIQHGIIAPHNVDYRFSTEEVQHAFPDHFLAWGEAARTFLSTQSHLDRGRIHVVGRLLSDALVDIAPDPRLLAFKQGQGRALLFFASQPQQNPKNRDAAAHQLAAFCRAHGLCCAVKLHPGETDDGLYRRVFDAQGLPDRWLMHDGALYSAIAACDYGATCFSTVALEIMSLRKPLVVFDPFGLDLLEMRRYPSVYHVGADQEPFDRWKLQQAAHVAFNEQLAEAVLGPWDGQVAARVEAVLARYTGGQAGPSGAVSSR
jgi:hypothetical protein